MPPFHPNFDHKRLKQGLHRSCVAFGQDAPNHSKQIAKMLSSEDKVRLAFGHGEKLRVPIAKLSQFLTQ